MKNYREYARHILEEADFIIDQTSGLSFDDFINIISAWIM